jgi:hypothetical protein
MKKIVALFASILMFSLCGPAFSQGRLPVKLGLKVSPNLAWLNPGTKGYSNDGTRMGATIGFVSDIYFAENYAFSTGFNFQYLNGKMKYQDERMIDTVLKTGEINRKYNFLYIEIPMMIKMKTNSFGKISFYGQIGLGTGFRVKSSVKEHYDFNGGTTLIRESILIGIGCEYKLDESSRIFVGFDYSNSLNNVLSEKNFKSGLNEKSMLNFAELTVGILF